MSYLPFIKFLHIIEMGWEVRGAHAVAEHTLPWGLEAYIISLASTTTCELEQGTVALWPSICCPLSGSQW